MTEFNDDNFIEALLSEDELGSVIRAHLHIEHNINKLIDLLVQNPNELKPLGLSYSNKIDLICALGVDPEIISCLQNIGKLRNRFAHRPFYTLNKSDTKDLFKSLRDEEKSILQNAYEGTTKSMMSKVFGPYSQLIPRNQFIILAVVIRRATENILLQQSKDDI